MMHRTIPIVRLQGVCKNYRAGGQAVAAIAQVSFTISRGEFFALAGPSGSGKTTLLNLIGGIDVADEGDVWVDGQSLAGLDPLRLAKFRSRKIGFVFQTFNLIPTLTAIENVEYPLLLLGDGGKKRRMMAAQALERVGLHHQMRRKPSELSGGQRQRVAIARAMVKNPRLILADEPTANLDRATASEILDLMEKLNREHFVTFIFSTHDSAILARAQRVWHVGSGELEKKDAA